MPAAKNNLALLNETAEDLSKAGIESPKLDARILLEQATGLSKEKILLGDFELTEKTKGDLEKFLERRKAREPISHITGSREFWSMNFKVSPAVLDPRPDSETLIEAVLELFSDRSAKLDIIDFGTGSGCLLLSVLKEFPNARGLGVDISKEALILSKRNSLDNALEKRAEFIEGSWGEGLSGKFDLIISNPPYIIKKEIETLAPEVALYEPKMALDGGNDGLECYRALLPDIKRLLKKNGFAVIEIGKDQENDLALIAEKKGLEIISRKKDLAGIIRCLVLTIR